MTAPRRAQTPPGPGVDATGQAVVDPTKNVLDTLNAAVKRLDDLREADLYYREAESRHHQEISRLRHDYETELRKAEANRIDAIRAVDQGTVQRAAEVQAQQATTLATQVAATAEAFSTRLQTSLNPILESIAKLQQAQYETQGGRAQVVESRDVRGETRLNYGAIFGALAVLISLIGVIVLISRSG